MMFFRTKAPSPAGYAVDLSLWGRGRPNGPGEGVFSEQNCTIWNDIRRALEAK